MNNNGEITISLGGIPRKLKFSMWVVEELQRLNDLPVPSHRFASKFATDIIYAGLANTVRIQLKENDISESQLDFKWKDVNNWIYELYDSDSGIEVIKLVTDCYTNCNAYKALTKNNDDDEAKKNLNGVKSTPLPLVKSA